MKGIKVQDAPREERFESTETEYLVQIDGQWYKVTHIEQPILDGRHACSSNIHKWDHIGNNHEFSIESAQEPEEELPDKVNEFIRRFQETGKNRENLSEPSGNVSNYPGHEWGWGVSEFTYQ